MSLTYRTTMTSINDDSGADFWLRPHCFNNSIGCSARWRSAMAHDIICRVPRKALFSFSFLRTPWFSSTATESPFEVTSREDTSYSRFPRSLFHVAKCRRSLMDICIQRRHLSCFDVVQYYRCGVLALDVTD
jgi:hypothetical protein